MTINAADTVWILVSAALVMLMTPGLALFYGGMVRRKNILSTLMMSFVCLGVVGLLWFGWFGFNAGSALTAGGLAANAFVTTNTSAAAAAVRKESPAVARRGIPGGPAAQAQD
jgi:ammonia channel protein AmtB